jgi:hypothetical protein
MIRLFILAQGCRYDLDRMTVTQGDLTLPLHPAWLLFSNDSEAYTAGWGDHPEGYWDAGPQEGRGGT